MHLQVRLDHPVMAIRALALEQEGVRPRPPLFPFVQVAFGAADGFVDQRDAAGQPDAPGPGVEFQKLAIRQAGHQHRFAVALQRQSVEAVRGGRVRRLRGRGEAFFIQAALDHSAPGLGFDDGPAVLPLVGHSNGRC